MPSLMERIIRAAKLDVHLYEEVETDASAMGQAVTVVVLSSLAAGIDTIGRLGWGGILLGTINGLSCRNSPNTCLSDFFCVFFQTPFLEGHR